MRLRTVHQIIGATIVACVLVGLVLLLVPLHTAPSVAARKAITNADVSADQEDWVPANRVKRGSFDDATTHEQETVDLLTICSDPASDVLTDACLQALDKLFLNWTFGSQIHYGSDPTTSRLGYGRIFANSAADRTRVFATLERSECFLEGDDFQAYWERNMQDRKESCHAEAFTNYAQFNLICAGFRDGRDAEREWIDPHLAIYSGKTRFQHYLDVIEESRKSNDNASSYEHRRKWLWEEVLEVRWLKRKCTEFGSVPVMDADRDVREYELLRSHIAKLDPSLNRRWESRNARSNIYEALVKLATYLGGGRTTVGYRQGGEAWEELVYGRRIGHDEEEHPWRVDLDRRKFDPTYGRGTRLLTAMYAVYALEREGIEFDWHWLVESVCKESDYQGTDELGNRSCQDVVHDFRNTLVQGLKELHDPEDMESNARNHESAERYFRVLDRFERIALELGIYDRTGSLRHNTSRSSR